MAVPYFRCHGVFSKPNPAFVQLRKKIRRSSLLPSEECFPLQGVRRKVRFLSEEDSRGASDPATQSTDLSPGSPRSPTSLVRASPPICKSSSSAPRGPTPDSGSVVSGAKMRDGAASHRHRSHSHGTHAMVNRSDSEKLSEVKLLFKSEAHIQRLPISDRSSLKKKASATKDSVSLEDLELFDVRRPPFWRPSASHHPVAEEPCSAITGASAASAASAPGGGAASFGNGGGRRRSTVAPSDVDSCDRVAVFRLDTLVEGSCTREEKEEKILEVLREIVRKCSIGDSTRRPTAHDLLAILTIKSHDLRDKLKELCAHGLKQQ